MIAKYIALCKISSVVSDHILRICIQEPLFILKQLQFFFILYQHTTAYSSAIKFTRLISGNICVQDELMVKPIYALVLIQYHVKRIFSSFILVFTQENLKKTNKYYFSNLSFKPLPTKKKESIYLSFSLTNIPSRH